MRQPEALRLAAQLEDTESARLHLLFYAAAEMRGLYDENAPLREANMAWAASKELRRLYDENQRLHAQRDALLEALKRMASIIDKMGDMPDGFIHPSPWQTLKCEEALTQARAAIKAVEGEDS